MLIFETFALSSLLFLFCLIFYLPLGILLLNFFAPRADKDLHLSFSIAVSALFFAFFTSVFVLLGLPNIVIRLFFCSAVLLSLSRIDLKASFKYLKTIWQGPFICFLYFLLLCLTASFPIGDFRDVLPNSINHLTGYPIDNLIPYNVSRYFVERIDPRVTEVVPTWAFSDRGPLAGILHAAFCILLGIKEKTHWLGASSGLYFVFQAHMLFLNIASFFALWMFVKKSFSKKAAGYSLVLIGSTSFMFLNTIFTWPKLFMCYFLVLALEILSPLLINDSVDKKVSHFVLGSLFALGALAHDMMLFYLVGLCLYLLFRSLREKTYFFTLLNLTISFFVTYLPWQIYKSFFSGAQSRLIHLHFFCVQKEQLEGKTLAVLLSDYFDSVGFSGFVDARVSNFLYPFDITAILPLIPSNEFGFYRLLRAFASLAPYQLFFSLGVPLFLLSALGMYSLKDTDSGKRLLSLILICFLSFIPVIFLFSCARPVNHAWVYPLMMILVVPAAIFLSKKWHWLFLPVAIGWNLVVLVFELWFRDESSLYLSSDPNFLIVQSLLFLLFIASGFLADE